MTGIIPPTNGSATSSESPGKDQAREAFRQCLRRADKLILENKFDEARRHLVDAAKMNPTHPMLDVFAERLELALRTSPPVDQTSSDSSKPAGEPESGKAQPANGDGSLAVIVRTTPQLESQANLLHEYESMRRQYEELKASLEESSKRQQAELKAESERQLQEQLDLLRKSEQAILEQKGNDIRRDVEAALRIEYDQKLQEESKQLQSESASLIESERTRHEEEKKQIIREQGTSIAREYDRKMVLLGTTIPRTKEEQVAFYRERIRPCYRLGQPSVEDEQKIIQLREVLQLTPEDFRDAESDVRLERYVEVVEERIHAGELNLNNPAALEELKKQYRLTPEESSRLESYIFSAFQRLAFKGRILLVDDDPSIRTSLGRVLTDSGYQVIESPDIRSALEQLDSNSIDLILSDVRFAAGELDGFKFFKTVLEQPRAHPIPFVLMSALDDGVIIRSGMQLGIDEYLTKPIDPDLLIAVIEGKMKRYRSYPKRNDRR